MPADYNIPMTDAQITEALQLMVERVSEGWAQETYDGSPVGSGSPYYHKSSKWWATQAADAAARAEAAVPAGTAGAVFFDRAQTLTTAQQEQARQNIKAGGSNPNLLINPFFTVNQRGTVSGTTGFAADRWNTTYGSGGMNWSRGTNGITMYPNTNSYAALFQKLDQDLVTALTDKTITASVLLGNNDILSTTTTFTAQTKNIGQNVQISIAPAQNVFQVRTIIAGVGATIKAVKLELGTVSTLANDMPPSYEEELSKCMYDCHVIEGIGYGKIGMAVAAGSIRVPIPCVMRSAPSISFTGSFTAIGEGVALAISNILVNTKGADVVELNCQVSGATQYGIYALTMTNGSKIVLGTGY